MKLIFTKNDINEIDVSLQKGTIIEKFTYTEMISQLLINNKFEETEYNGLSKGEQEKIEVMLKKITAIFEDDSSKTEIAE